MSLGPSWGPHIVCVVVYCGNKLSNSQWTVRQPHVLMDNRDLILCEKNKAMAFPELWLGDFRASERITGWFPIYRYDLFHDLFTMISSIARSDQIYIYRKDFEHRWNISENGQNLCFHTSGVSSPHKQHLNEKSLMTVGWLIWPSAGLSK